MQLEIGAFTEQWGCAQPAEWMSGRVQTPGYVHKVGFLGTPTYKNPPQKNPHFYFNLILDYTLYATNNAIFYCFKAFT